MFSLIVLFIYGKYLLIELLNQWLLRKISFIIILISGHLLIHEPTDQLPMHLAAS